MTLPSRGVARRLAAGALAAAFPLAAAVAWAQAPTVVEAVCLNGGRSASVCACAEERLFTRLGQDPYAEYEAVAQAYLANPSGGWDGASQDVAAVTGDDAEAVLRDVQLYGQFHREEIRSCL